MVIIGAKGHAKEVLDCLLYNGFINDIYFFDDVSTDLPEKIFNKYPVIRSYEEVASIFKTSADFILGLGNPVFREKLAQRMETAGGKLRSVISDTSLISQQNVLLGSGLNIMHRVLISCDVEIGKGTLLNAGANLHHDVKVGEFCEISPNVTIAGRVKIGEKCAIGAGATLLPDVKIGNKVTIGAGAVVTHDLPDNCIAVGVPARIIKVKPE